MSDGAVCLSLCMIVRNSSGTLPACLESIRPWVDEIVVVDTGSKDDTPAIAEHYGARLFHFPWCDDFSAARNESIRHARGEWVFWMDSDDTISVENGKKLRELADQPLESAPMAHVMQVHCPGGNSDASDVTVVDHVKMFRNMPELRFEGRIHEQVLPAIRRLGGEIAWSDVFVVHSGSDHSPEGRRRKQQRDLRLLELELADRPDHPFALFNLGMTYGDMGDFHQAVAALRRSLEVSAPAESHVRKAYALLVGGLTELERWDEAQESCNQGREHYPNDPELLFRRGILAHHFGRLEEAAQAYSAALDDGDERHFTSIDRGVIGFKSRHNLAVVYTDMGKLGLAELQWRMALDEAPQYRPAWRGLGASLIQQGKYVTATIEAAQAADDPALRSDAISLQAEVSRAQGDGEAAVETLRQAIEQNPDDEELIDRLCRLLFERGDLSESEPLLARLAKMKPDDGAVHCNLGAVYAGTGRWTLAADSLRRSLSVRPHSAPTLMQLASTLVQLGKTDEAIAAWRQADELAPGDPKVKQALREAGQVG